MNIRIAEEKDFDDEIDEYESLEEIEEDLSDEEIGGEF